MIFHIDFAIHCIRFPKLEASTYAPPPLFRKLLAHEESQNRRMAVLKVQRVFRMWFLKQFPEKFAAFQILPRYQKRLMWSYPPHPSRVFSRYLIGGLSGKARSSLLRDFITINSLFKFVSKCSQQFYKYLIPKLWVEHRVPFVFAVTEYREPLLENVRRFFYYLFILLILAISSATLFFPF